MQKLLLTLSFLAFSFHSFSQDYKEVLTKTITAFDSSWGDFNGRVQSANKLNLIAKKFDKEWAPQYYAAYAQANLALSQELGKDADKKDAYLDEAELHLADAVKLLGKETDETHVLRAMIANNRIGIDPQKRWQKYGKIFEKELDEAKELNAENPRMYLLKGISKRYTPSFFGGGKKAAKPYFDKAKAFLDAEPNTDITKPYWGEATVAYFLKDIEGKDEE